MPVSHVEHALLAAAAANCPGMQSVQYVEAATGANVPVGHSVHAETPLPEM